MVYLFPTVKNSIISNYFKFNRTLNNFLGKCPFHQENTTSCVYNASKDTFFCLQCGEHGNGDKLADVLSKKMK